MREVQMIQLPGLLGALVIAFLAVIVYVVLFAH